MIRSCLAVALCAAACGEVDKATPVDAAVDAVDPVDATPDASSDAGAPRTYKGGVDMVSAMFGGAPFCMYRITLQQLEIELGILPSGEVASGRVQNLNIESVIPSTSPNCPADFPVIMPNIATYTLQSAMPSTNGQTLTFKGGATNNPPADLTVELMSVGSALQATLGFHRNNQPPPLDWSVIVTVSLSLQPAS